MITLSPIQRRASSPCDASVFIDVTDYNQSTTSAFRLSAFTNGLRIIRLVAPSGEVTLYSFSQLIVNGTSPTTFLTVTDLQCQITALNNENYEFDLNLEETGEYEIDILSIPRASPSGAYVDGDMYCDVVGGNYIIYKKTSGTFSPLFTDEDFTGVTESYINRFIFTPVCTFSENIACVFSYYESAFCGRCNCGDVCKNKKSNNILKATLMLRELELIQDSEVEYNAKLSLYTSVMQKLCQCS